MSEVQRINISLLVPPSGSARVGTLAQHLPRADQLFSVADPGRLAHLTLYMSMFPAKKLVQLEERLQQLAPGLDPVALRCQGLAVTTGNYVELAYEKTPELRRLQQDVVRAVCDLRDQGASAIPDHANLPGGQRANLDDYGYDLLGAYFRPHVTLARYAVEPDLDHAPFDETEFDWHGTVLMVSVADPYGSARQALTEVVLA